MTGEMSALGRKPTSTKELDQGVFIATEMVAFRPQADIRDLYCALGVVGNP